jgi:hypothetical protein
VGTRVTGKYSVDIKVGKSFPADSFCAPARRESADHDEANTMVDQQAVESKPGLVSHLKNSLSMASGGAMRLRALPKNCHLLPSTAISEPQKRYD